jgi:hypothetical protein
MKKSNGRKMLAAAGLPIAMGVIGMSSATSLAGCGDPLILSNAQLSAEQPEFSEIFDCDKTGTMTDGMKSRVSLAYDAVWADNKKLVGGLAWGRMKRLPIVVGYDKDGPGDSVRYSHSDFSIRICGTVGDDVFAEMLNDAMAAYFCDPETDAPFKGRRIVEEESLLAVRKSANSNGR